MFKKQIKILNKPGKRPKKLSPSEQNFKSYVEQCDISYRKLPIVRSYYNKEAGLLDNIELVYIISGRNVKKFEDIFVKDIGRCIPDDCSEESVNQNAAINFYHKAGEEYVNDPNLRLKDKNGVLYTLTTIFSPVKNKLGKITGYIFEDARFLPEKNNLQK